MPKTPSNKATAAIVVLISVIVASWIAFEAVRGPSVEGQRSTSAPALVLRCSHRDVGPVTQGAVVKASFTVENAGSRRLVLVEKRGACCGQSAHPRSIVLEPGEKTELGVEADTAQWFGHMDHRVKYFTNDPARPRFELQLTATVTSGPSA